MKTPKAAYIPGVFNMGGSLGHTENAFQQEMRQADQKKAMQIAVLSILVGFAAAGLAFVL